MKARVRQVKTGTSVRYIITKTASGQTYSSNVPFTFNMVDTIGQVYYFQNHRFGETLANEWFWQPELEFYYHKSWLDEIPEVLVMDDTGSDESDY